MNKKLNETHPELCLSWHPKNELKPSDVTYGTKRKVWWFCNVGVDHIWQASVVSRTKWPGCPFCSGQRTAPSTCLANKKPDVAKLWHPTLNKLTAHDVSVSSAKKIWWQCLENPQHIWLARVFSVAKNGSGCPYCANKKADQFNNLATKYPNLVNEWDIIKNINLTPNDVVPGSGQKVWWLCPRGHSYKSSIVHRTIGGRKLQGCGCPYCSGQAVNKENSLATNYPSLAEQWHPTKNGKLTPNDVVPNSHQSIWWKCNKADDHEWKAAVYYRTTGNNCPCCSGQKVVLSNCLATTHPEISKEWNQEKNIAITPKDVTYACNSQFWWQCSINPDHQWKARVSSRTGGTNCPFCSFSKGEKAIKDILDKKKINYIPQYRFPDCKNIRCLPFDFAIFKENKVAGVIEFQGRQHYFEVSYFGGKEGHEFTKKRDKIKYNYCEERNIPLLRLPFWNVAIIENELKKFLQLET